MENEAIVAILQRRLGRSPTVQHHLQCFFFYEAFYQFEYTVEHLPGVQNTTADALSWNNFFFFSHAS